MTEIMVIIAITISEPILVPAVAIVGGDLSLKIWRLQRAFIILITTVDITADITEGITEDITADIMVAITGVIT